MPPWSGIVPAGGEIAIIDLGGNQAVDCLLYNPHDTAERYCAHTTIAAQRNIFLTTGSVLLSNEGRPMLRVVEDTCGRHDTIGGACSQESNTLRYGFHTKHQHACVENFLLEGSTWGLSKRDIVSNINWYMNVPVEPDGTLGIVDGISAPGPPRAVHRGDGHARARQQLPADQQPVQRLRPHAGPHRRQRHVMARSSRFVAA